MTYKVKLNIFEGPLDLLLFLIKRDKIEIYDISISSITDQYLEYIELMKLLDLDIAGEFLVMAATLMHIKSKLLLPVEEDALEEDEEEDPRDELIGRLLEYKKYKDASEQLADLHNKTRNIFFRKGSGEKTTIVTEEGDEYFEASLFDLITSFRKILKKVPKEIFHKVVKDSYSVSDKIQEIFHLLAKKSKLYFTELFERSKSKDEMITIFMATLELMKMKEILVVQKDVFGEVEIVRNSEMIQNNDENIRA